MIFDLTELEMDVGNLVLENFLVEVKVEVGVETEIVVGVEIEIVVVIVVEVDFELFSHNYAEGWVVDLKDMTFEGWVVFLKEMKFGME